MTKANDGGCNREEVERKNTETRDEKTETSGKKKTKRVERNAINGETEAREGEA